MALLSVFAVRDSATDSFGLPIFQVSVRGAIRLFSDEVNRQDSAMNLHPEDYELFVIGTYDQDKGILSPFAPEQCCTGKAAFRPREV